MNKLFAIAVLGLILLVSSISYAGDKLSSSEKKFVFSGKQDVAVKKLNDTEAQTTYGKFLGEDVLALGDTGISAGIDLTDINRILGIKGD